MNSTHPSPKQCRRLPLRKAGLLLALFLGAAPWWPVSAEPPAGDEVQRRAVLSAARNALALGDLSGAVVFYERYLEQNPGSAAVPLELAGVLLQTERFEAALPVLNSLLLRDPSNPQALRLRAVALSRTGNTEEALSIAERLVSRFPDDLEIRRLAAGLRAARGEVIRVRDLQQEWSMEGIRSTEDWEMFLQLLVTAGEWEKIREVTRETQSRFEPSDPARLSLIRAHLALADPAAAMAVFEQMETGSGQREAVLPIADQLAAARRLDEAVRILEPVSRAWPGDAGLARRLALLYAYDNRPVEAVGVLAGIPDAHRDDRTRVALAEIYRAAGQPYQALRELDRLSPTGQHALYAAVTRAGVLFDLHREWEIPVLLAPFRLEQMGGVEAEEQLVPVLTTLAHIRAGDTGAALETIEHFRAHAPRNITPDVLEAINAVAGRRTSSIQESASRLGTLLRHYRPGLDLVRPALLNDVPAAAWQNAWNLNPGNAPLLLWWAGTTFRQGRIEEARALYQAAARHRDTRADAMLGLLASAIRLGHADDIENLIAQLTGEPLRFRQSIEAARLLLEAGFDGHADYFITSVPGELVRHPDAVAVRAAWLLRTGRVEEARLLLARIEPDSPARMGARVYQLYRMGTLARNARDPVCRFAVDRLRELAGTAADLSSLDILLPAVDLMIQFNRYADARELLDPVQKQWPEDLRLSERAAVVHIRTGEHLEAERHVRSLSRRRPMTLEPRLLLARLQLWSNQHPAAWSLYRTLIEDYPHDLALVHEYEAKRNMALGRHRNAARSYSEWLALEPGDREARLERADSYFIRDLSRTAAQEYRAIAAAFPNDAQARASLRAAERRTAWGILGEAGFDQRRGRDGAADIREEFLGAGVLLPRGADGLQVGAGGRWVEWRFEDAPESSRTLRANEVYLQATQQFHGGMETRGEAKLVDDGTEGTTWHAEIDLGYRGLNGWKAAVIAGREIVRDNFYTMDDALSRTWLGLYGQWQPHLRLELFGQARVINTASPSRDAALPARTLDLEGFTADRRIVLEPAPAGTLGDALDRLTPLPPSTRGLLEDTFRRNTAYEGVLDAKWTVFFFPRSLRLWANGFLYETRHDSLLYWTPGDTFYSGQVGAHWRHAPWQRNLAAGRSFFYGASVGTGIDSENTSFNSLLFELGWVHGNGLSLKAETGGVWSQNYDERHARLFLEYRF